MRQQYHIRQVGEDTHVWDVNRLLRLHANVPTQAVALSQIAEIQQAYWFPNTHPSTADIVEHMRLVEAADLAYPILMDAEGKLMDGMHRVAQALRLGHTHILAVRFVDTPAPDYVGVAPADLPY